MLVGQMRGHLTPHLLGGIVQGRGRLGVARLWELPRLRDEVFVGRSREEKEAEYAQGGRGCHCFGCTRRERPGAQQ